MLALRYSAIEGGLVPVVGGVVVVVVMLGDKGVRRRMGKVVVRVCVFGDPFLCTMLIIGAADF